MDGVPAYENIRRFKAEAPFAIVQVDGRYSRRQTLRTYLTMVINGDIARVLICKQGWPVSIFYTRRDFRREIWFFSGLKLTVIRIVIAGIVLAIQRLKICVLSFRHLLFWQLKFTFSAGDTFIQMVVSCLVRGVSWFVFFTAMAEEIKFILINKKRRIVSSPPF